MEVTSFIKDLGFPAGLAFILCLIIYKVSVKFIDEIIKPLKDTHLEFIRSLKSSIESLSLSQTNLINTVSTISKTIEALEDRLEELNKK